SPLVRAAGPHVPVASEWAQPDRVRGVDAPRHALHRSLEPGAGPGPHPQDRARRARGSWRELNRWRAFHPHRDPCRRSPMGNSHPLVLVVEDEPSLLRAMSKALGERDLDVRAALDIETAIRHLERCTPQIACIDLELPFESGYELCEYIR